MRILRHSSIQRGQNVKSLHSVVVVYIYIYHCTLHCQFNLKPNVRAVFKIPNIYGNITKHRIWRICYTLSCYVLKYNNSMIIGFHDIISESIKLSVKCDFHHFFTYHYKCISSAFPGHLLRIISDVYKFHQCLFEYDNISGTTSSCSINFVLFNLSCVTPNIPYCVLIWC
jgi:hypothetical protein